MKFLYALALFQLVAGPLVIFQVSLLCKLTVREMPRSGVGPAFQRALESEDFQAAVLQQGNDAVRKDDKKSPSPDGSGPKKMLSGKEKMPATDWRLARFLAPPSTGMVRCSDWSRRWTPVWPQAPPGPPPRVG